MDENAVDYDSGRITISPRVTQDQSDTAGAIAESARAATTSLQRLAQLQYAARARDDDSFRQEFSVELSGLASVEYTGPFEPLLEQIADTAGVTINKIGNPTATAIIVSVSAQSSPLSDIVQNVAYQIQSHARISFNPDKQSLEIIYLNT